MLNLLPNFGRAKRGQDADELDVTEPESDEIDDLLDDDGSNGAEIQPVKAVSVSEGRQSDVQLGRDQLRELQAALDELGECRRLIDAALTSSD